MTKVPLAIATEHRDDDASIDALVVDRAIPVIDMVIRRRCRGWSSDRDDLRSEVLVRLLRRMREVFTQAAAPMMDNFEGYVARIASHVVDDAIRVARPEWTRLKHRVRYLATHDARFLLTSGDSEVASVALAPANAGARLRSSAAESLAKDVMAVLRERGSLPLDDLVCAIAEKSGITEPLLVSDGRCTLVSEQDPETHVQTGQILRRLWSEITLLPPRQRIALLLHARDLNGESVLRLLLATALISADDIAVTLEVSSNRLTALLHDVPLSDAVIAESLDLSVQQVINLRKAARDRLARRIARPR